MGDFNKILWSFEMKGGRRSHQNAWRNLEMQRNHIYSLIWDIHEVFLRGRMEEEGI